MFISTFLLFTKLCLDMIHKPQVAYRTCCYLNVYQNVSLCFIFFVFYFLCLYLKINANHLLWISCRTGCLALWDRTPSGHFNHFPPCWNVAFPSLFSQLLWKMHGWTAFIGSNLSVRTCFAVSSDQHPFFQNLPHKGHISSMP